jgi:hypothetical protein
MSKRSHFESDWAFGDRLYIDGDRSIKATVVGFRFGVISHVVMLEWMHDGKSQQAEIELFRLSAAE